KTKEAITEEGAKKSVILEPGSLIFANCGVSLGFARIITMKGCIHDGWLSLENINETVLNKIFLLKLINSITHYFRNTAPDGTQPNLNTSIMKKFPIPLPPIELQSKFKECYMEIEAQKTKAQASLKKSEELFNALLQRSFSGKE
ncbi:MAG: restriction endonuclease subunit S, partial [Saprospiraceae bacterium]|nr:restriction endonuclease subunit S [Saprospiraceae bacterium]